MGVDNISYTEAHSDDNTPVVKPDDAGMLHPEEEHNNDGSSVLEILERDASLIGDSFETSPFVAEEGENGFSIYVSGEGSQPSAMEERRYTDLHLLSGSHDSPDFGKLRMILVRNCDLEARNIQYFTPLAIAIRSKNIRAVYALLMAGADIEARYNDGQICLHLACGLGNKKAVNALLRLHVNVLVRDNRGYTARNLAVLTGRSDIINLLPYASGNISNTFLAKSPTIKTRVETVVTESDTSDSVLLPPLLKPQDLALRPKIPQELPPFRELSLPALQRQLAITQDPMNFKS